MQQWERFTLWYTQCYSCSAWLLLYMPANVCFTQTFCNRWCCFARTPAGSTALLMYLNEWRVEQSGEEQPGSHCTVSPVLQRDPSLITLGYAHKVTLLLLLWCLKEVCDCFLYVCGSSLSKWLPVTDVFISLKMSPFITLIALLFSYRSPGTLEPERGRLRCAFLDCLGRCHRRETERMKRRRGWHWSLFYT